MSGAELRLCHLYPELMNLYGDRGNVIALKRRCEWRGIRLEVVPLSFGDEIRSGRYDMIFLGGGQDREQRLIFDDLRQVKGRDIVRAVEEGVPLLCVCGGFQLLGRFYRTFEGDTIPGVGAFDVWTEGGKKRLIGNAVIESDIAGKPRTVVGFENHSGRTSLGEDVRPLGRVVVGYGNNGVDGWEGAVVNNSIGTYLHGSLLPKNPWLADYLISRALERRYGDGSLVPLDDRLEETAHKAAIVRSRETASARTARRHRASDHGGHG